MHSFIQFCESILEEDKSTVFLTKMLAQKNKDEQASMITAYVVKNGNDVLDDLRAAAEKKGKAYYKKVDTILTKWDFS